MQSDMIDKTINEFNKKYYGKYVTVCPIMNSLYLDEIDWYTFCCAGTGVIPRIGLVRDFMSNFSKEYY